MKDFTALIILIDLDNLLAATAGVDFEKLNIFEQIYNEETKMHEKELSLQKWVNILQKNNEGILTLKKVYANDIIRKVFTSIFQLVVVVFIIL